MRIRQSLELKNIKYLLILTPDINTRVQRERTAENKCYKGAASVIVFVFCAGRYAPM